MNFFQQRPWNRERCNTLLLKDEVGRGKSTTFTLPDEKFMYGKAIYRDPETAGDSNFNKFKYKWLPLGSFIESQMKRIKKKTLKN
jgi:hypothetical protein